MIIVRLYYTFSDIISTPVSMRIVLISKEIVGF